MLEVLALVVAVGLLPFVGMAGVGLDQQGNPDRPWLQWLGFLLTIGHLAGIVTLARAVGDEREPLLWLLAPTPVLVVVSAFASGELLHGAPGYPRPFARRLLEVAAATAITAVPLALAAAAAS